MVKPGAFSSTATGAAPTKPPTRPPIGAYWRWWLDCPLWKPFVDFLRQCPRSNDPLFPMPPSVWEQRSPLYGLCMLVAVFGSLAGLVLLVLH